MVFGEIYKKLFNKRAAIYNEQSFSSSVGFRLKSRAFSLLELNTNKLPNMIFKGERKKAKEVYYDAENHLTFTWMNKKKLEKCKW